MEHHTFARSSREVGESYHSYMSLIKHNSSTRFQFFLPQRQIKTQGAR